MIDAIVFLVALLLIVTKFFDCYTTAVRITHINQEQNNVARKLMEMIGLGKTIWLIFGTTVLITAVLLIILFWAYDNGVFKVVFILGGSVVSLIQVGVAITNSTGKANLITRNVARVYRWM